MSLEEAYRKSVQGLSVGKLLLTTGIGAIITLSGATLHTVYIDHSAQLTSIASGQEAIVASVNELKQTVHNQNEDVGRAMGKLADDDRDHAVAIGKAETEIEELEQHDRSAPRVERESMAEPAMRAPPLPPPLPAIGNALLHIFPGLQPHHHWRGRR